MAKTRYVPDDRMSDLVSADYWVLLIMSRFGIRLGVGDKTIAEVCAEYGVDTGTFLAIANLLFDAEATPEAFINSVSASALVDYLHNSHDYFLGYRLPGIRRDLIGVLDDMQNELNRAVIGYFDGYVKEVRRHMNYEEQTVFPYVRALLDGTYQGKYNIGIFCRRHDQVEARLREFKQILVQYYPGGRTRTNDFNAVLFDIFTCERDLASHNAIEDRLFVPVILEAERKAARCNE